VRQQATKCTDFEDDTLAAACAYNVISRDPRTAAARAQVALYSFAFEDDAGELTRYLLPLLDLVNHRGGANAYVERHAPSRTFRLLALVDIRCGGPRQGGALMLPSKEGGCMYGLGRMRMLLMRRLARGYAECRNRCAQASIRHVCAIKATVPRSVEHPRYKAVRLM